MLNAVSRVAQASAGRRVHVVVAGMVMTLLAAVAITASAQPAPPPPAPPPGMPMDHGPGPGMHGMHGGMHGGMHEGMMFGGSPRMIDHMLDGLGASDAQRNQIKQIAAAAGADMKAQRQAGRALRERAMQALTAPTVDTAAVEQVRMQMVQQHDQASRRMTQAMVDIARVLTPEQRAKVAERMKDHRARMDERAKRMERERAPR